MKNLKEQFIEKSKSKFGDKFDYSRVDTTLYMRINKSGLSFEEAIQEDPFKRQIQYNGESHSLKEWCVLKNMEYNVVLNRIDKHKWTFEEAITVPKGCRRKKK